MASFFKYLDSNDRVVSTTNLSEQTALTQSTAWDGTDRASFVKLSSGSLSTHILDVSYIRSEDTTGSSTDYLTQRNLYKQMSKVLVGYDQEGNIQKFSLDADSNSDNNVLHNAFIVNINRGQFKDKIRTGTFSTNIRVSGSTSITLQERANNGVFQTLECQTGLYGPLYVVTASGQSASFNISPGVNDIQGLVFYEAGAVIVSPYIFAQSSSAANPSSSNADLAANRFGILSGLATSSFSGSTSLQNVLSGTVISSSAFAFYNKINSMSFQADTELNSTIYFCRAFNNEFNFSSNPTYLSSSEIYVKGGDPDAQPVSYITSVGLYDDKDQLLAVAKLSEPIKKTPDTELIARVRLDF